MNGTLQGRLINELELSGARSIEEANRYIRETYLSKPSPLARSDPL